MVSPIETVHFATMNKESAKKEIEKLIKDYEEHRNEYSQKGYDEHQFCTRILNKFFKALGWDVDNDENNSEYYCDVCTSPEIVDTPKG